MNTYKQLVEKDSGEKHHVMAFGRMNPITSGHEAVVNKLHSVAKENNASHNLIVSHSQDAKKNPLSSAQKVIHAKNAFSGTNVTAASKDAPTILHHAAAAHAAGVTHLHVIAGSDRHEEMHNLLYKYNGQNAAHGHYNFKKITVHSSGERDPDAEGTTGISASKMREHAASGNKTAFHAGAPSKMTPKQKDAMYNDVRKGMNLKEDVYTSEYKIKTWVDPVTGETKTRKIRPRRIEFKNSKMGGIPVQKSNIEETAPIAPSIGVHRIGVTVSEPDHPMVSKRNETQQKFVRVTAHDKDKAIEQGKKHFKKKGFKVHGAEHSGMVYEETKDQQTDRAMQLKRFNDQMINANGPQVDTEIANDKKEKEIMFGKLTVKKAPFGLSKKGQDTLADVNETLRPEMGAGAYITDFIKSTNPRFNNKSKEERRRMAMGAYMATKAKGMKEEVVVEGTDNHYADSENHLNSAVKALETSDMPAHHFHMSNHHEAMGRWHESKGRHSSADREYAKAEEHHEKGLAASKSPSRSLKSERKLRKEEVVSEEDIGKHNNATTGFKPLVKKLTPKYGKEAAGRIAGSIKKKVMAKEEVQIDELSTDLLSRYKTSSAASAKAADASGNYAKGNKRFSGIIKATKKQLDNDMKKENKNDIPFDGPYKSNFKKPNNPNRTGMDSARSLAQRAMDQVNTKKPVKEAKDPQEYGYEGEMALNQLKTLVRCAEMIEDMLKPETDLPEWVQSKITLATDYIQTAADYLYSESEVNEETKKDFKKFSKYYKPEMHEGVLQDNGTDKIEPTTSVPKKDADKPQTKGKVVKDFKFFNGQPESQVTAVVREAAQKGVNVDKINTAGQEPHEEKFETVKKNITKLKKVKEGTMKSYKEFLESLDEKLNGKQKKLDKNHNGKLDAKDFEMLRKEEFEELDEIKMSELPSRSIKGKSYGADYEDPEGAYETSADMKKKTAGRKAGQSTGSYKPRKTMSKLKQLGATYK